jgi:hypothetical protein
MPIGQRVARYLDKLPMGDVVDSKQVCRSARVNTTSLKDCKDVAGYRYGGGMGGRVWWGSKKTIAELRRQVGA